MFPKNLLSTDGTSESCNLIKSRAIKSTSTGKHNACIFYQSNASTSYSDQPCNVIDDSTSFNTQNDKNQFSLPIFFVNHQQQENQSELGKLIEINFQLKKNKEE